MRVDRFRTRYFDPVEWKEPDEIPDPDNAGPCPAAPLNIGETPIGPDGDERSDQLSEEEGGDEHHRWTLPEEEALRACDEDQG